MELLFHEMLEQYFLLSLLIHTFYLQLKSNIYHLKNIFLLKNYNYTNNGGANET